MRKAIAISLFCLIFSLNTSAQITTVKGNAKTYAGDTLCILAYSDYLSMKEEKLADAIVSSNGDFTFNFRCDEVRYAFIQLDVFSGFIFLEPGKNYEIVLPKKQNRAIEDQLNPYFKPMEFFISQIAIDKQSLNSLIPEFEKAYAKNLP